MPKKVLWIALSVCLFCAFFFQIPPNRNSLQNYKLHQEPLSGPIQPLESNQAIPFGNEFWKKTEHSDVPITASAPLVSRAMERVACAFRKEKDGSYLGTGPGGTTRITKDQVIFETGGLQTVLSTDEIRSNGAPLKGISPSDWLISGNTAQRKIQENVLEHIEAIREGIEMTWVVFQQPASGSLTVSASLSGVHHQGTTPSGAHFASMEGGLSRVRVSHASVVDSDGKRWDVDIGAERNTFFVTLNSDILMAATYPLAIDPIITAEYGIDQTIASMPGSHDFPRIVHGETNSLVIWRAGTLLATRVGDDGAILDPGGLQVDPEANMIFQADVAYNGTNFLITWSGRQNGDQLRYRFLSTSGEFLTPVKVLANGRDHLEYTRVASDGRDFLVQWWESIGASGMQELWSAKIPGDITGSPASPRLWVSSFSAKPGSLIFHNTFYWALYTSVGSNNRTSLWLQQMDGEGTPLPPALAISEVNHVDIPMSIGSGESGMLATWVDQMLYGQWIDSSGRLLMEGRQTLSPTNGTFSTPQISTPAVSAMGTNFFVCWSGRYQGETTLKLRTAVFPWALPITPTNGFVLAAGPEDFTEPAVARHGTNYFLVWKESKEERSMIRGRKFEDPAKRKSKSFSLFSSPLNDFEPSIAASQEEFLLAWIDKNGGIHTGGSRVSSGGRIHSPNGFFIHKGSDLNSVASDGAGFLVASTDYTNLLMTIIGPNNTLLQNHVIRGKATSAHSVGTAFSEGIYLVIWNNGHPGSNGDTFYVRIAADGRLLDTTPRLLGTGRIHSIRPVGVPGGFLLFNEIPVGKKVFIPTAGDALFYPTIPGKSGQPISLMGTNVLIAIKNEVVMTNFENDRERKFYFTESGATPQAIASRGTDSLIVFRTDLGAVMGTLVNATGVVHGPFLIHEPLVGASIAYFGCAAINDHYLLTWADTEKGFWDIGGAIVYPNGRVSNDMEFACSILLPDRRQPSISFNGENYLVVWSDHRAPTGPDIFGVLLNPRGQLLTPEGLKISTASGSETQPRVGNDGTNFFVVWNDTRDVGRTGTNIYGTLIRGGGEIRTPNGQAMDDSLFHQSNARVAGTFQGFEVVWESDLLLNSREIRNLVLTPEGARQGLTYGILARGQVRNPQVASTTNTVVVAWEELTENAAAGWNVEAVLVNSAGFLSTGTLIDAAGDQTRFHLSASRSRYFGSWEHHENGQSDIHGLSFKTFTTRDPIKHFTKTSRSEKEPGSLALGEETFLVHWIDGGVKSALWTPQGIRAYSSTSTSSDSSSASMAGNSKQMILVTEKGTPGASQTSGNIQGRNFYSDSITLHPILSNGLFRVQVDGGMGSYLMETAVSITGPWKHFGELRNDEYIEFPATNSILFLRAVEMR